jgi:hypothetical protein
MNRLNTMWSKCKSIVSNLADQEGMATPARMQQVLRGVPGADERPAPNRTGSRAVQLLERMVAASGPNSMANLERAINRIGQPSRR